MYYRGVGFTLWSFINWKYKNVIRYSHILRGQENIFSVFFISEKIMLSPSK